ncbi:MAG: DUF4258 domain-containing protein [Dehalococcoidales bacterium]|jgi:hypothetical protein|nr:DUF4258 domain-containing protein [Dehalococcoidales bacterium]
MHIVLTRHAQQRMSERSIHIQNVKDCLQYYQVSRPGDGGKTIYDYTENGYKTSVAALQKGEVRIVVSVWRVTL